VLNTESNYKEKSIQPEYFRKRFGNYRVFHISSKTERIRSSKARDSLNFSDDVVLGIAKSGGIK
jgi:hypothetical protein